MMVPNMNSLSLPDIAAQTARQALPLEWVGMQGIALPVFLEGQHLNAKADAGVSLDDGEAAAFICLGCIWPWRHLNRNA